MFMPRLEVQRIIEQAIREKKLLIITYQHVAVDGSTVTRKQAPFDIGTTNPKTSFQNRDNLYVFCCEHIDTKSGMRRPMVHPININHIVAISTTDESFSPAELMDENMRNTGFNYRTWRWAIVPDRGWN